VKEAKNDAMLQYLFCSNACQTNSYPRICTFRC